MHDILRKSLSTTHQKSVTSLIEMAGSLLNGTKKALTMKVNVRKLAAALFLTGSVAAVNADVCNIVPGSVSCGRGSIDSLSNNGIVTVKGTIVSGATLINGLLNAEDATFFTLEVNGNVKLTRCTVNAAASVKGSLTASSTTFEKTLKVYSSETRFIHSKVSNDLHHGHTDSKKQIVYLDNFSEVSGDIIFDDGDGKVILKSQSKIGGKIIGGHVILK